MSPGGRRPGKGNARGDIIRGGPGDLRHPGLRRRQPARRGPGGRGGRRPGAPLLRRKSRPVHGGDGTALRPPSGAPRRQSGGRCVGRQRGGHGRGVPRHVGSRGGHGIVVRLVRRGDGGLGDRGRCLPRIRQGEGLGAASRPSPGRAEATTDVRRGLVASQLLGLAFARYVLRVPPLSTAAPAEIGRWAGPTVDRYSAGAVDDLPVSVETGAHGEP